MKNLLDLLSARPPGYKLGPNELPQLGDKFTHVAWYDDSQYWECVEVNDDPDYMKFRYVTHTIPRAPERHSGTTFRRPEWTIV